MAVSRDPDRFALAICQQYLYELGYTRALAALELESGLRVKAEPEQGGTLLQLVYDHIERQLAADSADDVEVQRRRLEEQLLSGGTASGPADCPSRLQRSIQGLHSSNILCIQCWPQRRQAATGSSDGSIHVFGYGGVPQRTMAAASSGVLCLALQDSSTAAGGSTGSGSSGGGSIVAAGCMDGSVVVLDAGSGHMLARASPHRKYVVAAAWAPDGHHLVTASWDQSFAVHRLQQQQPAAAAAAVAQAGHGEEQQLERQSAGSEAPQPGTSSSRSSVSPRDTGSSSSSGWELVCVFQEQCPSKVNAVQFLPTDGGGGGGRESSIGSSGSSSSSSSFLVAVQGSNYLRQLTITTAGASGDGSSSGGNGVVTSSAVPGGSGPPGGGGSSGGGVTLVVREERRINMNPLGDDHVSFSAAHLALSPCARLLLVSADNGRLVVYERAGWAQIRVITGLPTEQFQQYNAAWHRSGHYIMAGAAHGGVCIFHVGSAKLVATLAAHTQNVRGMCYDAPNNLLLTCSFDRSAKVFEAADAATATAGAAPAEGATAEVAAEAAA